LQEIEARVQEEVARNLAASEESASKGENGAGALATVETMETVETVAAASNRPKRPCGRSDLLDQLAAEVGGGLEFVSPLTKDQQTALAREIFSWKKTSLMWAVMTWARESMRNRLNRQMKRRLEKLEKKMHEQSSPGGGSRRGSRDFGAVSPVGAPDKEAARQRSLYALLEAQHEGVLLEKKKELALSAMLKLCRRALVDSVTTETRDLLNGWRESMREAYSASHEVMPAQRHSSRL